MRALYTWSLGFLCLCLWQGSAMAGQFSFTGIFLNDNDLQLFTFSLAAPGTVTLQTLGYGGGTNAANDTIPAGGFEPVLGLFDSLGTAISGPIQPGPDPTCPPRNPDPARFNFCQDAFAQFSLPAGSYIVSLTQSQNDPLGNLGDGFFYTTVLPDPNFNNGFVGSFGFPGNGSWALDIIGADAATEAGAVPEPDTFILAAGAVLAMAVTRKRARN